MKRLSLLLLLPLASGVLFAQYSITPATLPNGTVNSYYNAALTLSPATAQGIWSISAGSLPPNLSLSPLTGTSVAASISGNAITAGTYSFTVQANIPGALPIIVNKAYTITIVGPITSISPAALPNGTVGVPYSQQLQASGGYGPGTYTFAWDAACPGLSFSTTGAITGTPTTAGTCNNIFVSVTSQTVSNGLTFTLTQTYSITIGAPPLSITSGTLPDGVVGVFYFQNLTVTGGYGAGTYTFALTGGSPPPGLGLSGGAITGTPTAGGTYTFTVQVTSHSNVASSLTASGTYSINVTLPAPTITTSSLPAGTVGATYSQALGATGGTPPYTWSVTGSLPGGLTLDPAAGTISGTPTTPGSFPFQVTVHDSQQVTASANFTIRIAPVALVITTTSLPSGNVGTAYTATLAATGGTPPYTWSVTSNTLNGLTISSAGVISATPVAAGTFSVTVMVTDSAQATASKTYSITVVAGPKITTAGPLADGVTGVAYTQQFAATGGVTPYVWSVASGSIPSGLSLNTTTGLLSGTPDTAATYTFTIGVADQNGQKDSAAYSIRIVAPLTITTQSPLPGGTVGVAYTQTFAATGGTSPYQWSVSAGTTLPGGLTLSTAGSLTGTPTATGTFTFTVQVADSAARTATKAFTIIVASAVKITATPPLADGVSGSLYTQQFQASGGVTPYVWSIVSGSIPTGLSLNTATGLLSGTPTTPGTYAFTLGVTDQNGQKDSAAYSIRIVAPLTITTQAPLPGGVVGASYTQAFAATGGTSPYQWSVSAGTAPTGLTLSSTSGSLTGTLTAAGTFNFTIQVVDAAGRNTTASFTITVSAALTITTASPLPSATVGVAYNQALALSGGSAPFTWSIASGTLPPGIALTPGSLNGIPSQPGTFTFTVAVTGGGQTAKQFTLTVGVPPAPSLTFTALQPLPKTQPPLGISIPSPYPLDITGQVILTFAPDSPSPDGQEVVFTTTGTRTANFSVSANTTQVVFTGGTPGVQIGTVSGTITLTMKLTAGGIDITPSPAPSTTITIPKSAPVIIPQGVTVSPTSGGFNIVVVGYATSREMVSATITFTAAAGVNLASSQATVPLATVFTTWYQSSASAAYGSNFSLTMPFTIANGTSTNSLTSVSVVLTNAQGSSTAMSAAAH